MPGEQFSNSRIYLNINQGALRQTVTEDEYGARKRTYEKKDGTVKTVWEIVYKNWSGIIQRINIKDTEYGKQMEIDFQDARLTIPTDSQYFGSFVKKIMGADLSEEVTIQPYDFEPEPGKRKMGIVLYQNGEKLPDYYYDEVAQVNIHGFPPVNEAEKKNEGYWKHYFGYTVKNFLLAELSKLKFGNELPMEKEDEEIPTIGETSKVDEGGFEDEHEELRIEDVPF